MMALAGVSMVLGVAQSIVGYQQAQQQAERQNEYYRQNAEAANAAARAAYANLNAQRDNERLSATADKTGIAIKALQARGAAREAAGSAGVTGLSVDALVNDYSAQEGRQNEAVDINYQLASDNVRSQMDAIHSNTEARINSVQRAQPPSFLPFAIRGLSSVVNSAAGYLHSSYVAKAAGYSPVTFNSLGISGY